MAVTKKTSQGKKATAKPVRQKSTRPSLPNSRAKYVLTIMILSAVILFIVSKNRNNPVDRNNNVSTNNVKHIPDGNDTINRKENSKNDADSHESKPDLHASSEASLFYLVFQADESVKYVPVKTNLTSSDKYVEAMKLLISGPSESMKSRGYQSAFPRGVKVNGVKIIDRVAIIDLSSEISENAVGDILTARINQILFTMKSFDGVDGIEIRINGKHINTLGGDGHVFNWPLRERL